MDKKVFSPFASMLRRLLDDTGVLRRVDWAHVLDVSEAAISQWVNDQVLPRPENLRAIYTTLLADRRVSDNVLEEFDAFAQEPANRLSPHGDRMLPTIGHYMVRPVRDGFLRTLDTLAPQSQESVLLEAAARVREVRRTPQVLSVAERRRAAFEDLVAAAKRTNTVASAEPQPPSVPKEAQLETSRLAQTALLQIVGTRSGLEAFIAMFRHAARFDDVHRSRSPRMETGIQSAFMEAKASGKEVVRS